MTTYTFDKKEVKNAKWIWCWQILQYIGLNQANVSAALHKTIFGGPASFQSDDELYTGEIVLAINNNGIRNYEVSKKMKNLFKKFARPVLQDIFIDIGDKCTGKVRLFFREGELKKIQIATT